MASLEMIDMIQKNLEQDGILNKIRAQLLASVVNILNGNNTENKQQPKDLVLSFLSTEQGKLSFQIVADLFSVLKMSTTLTVFLGETGMEYSDKARFHLSDTLGVALDDNQPIILNILEKGISHQPKTSPTSKAEAKIVTKPASSPEEKTEKHQADKHHEPEKQHAQEKQHVPEKLSHNLKPVSTSKNHRKSTGHGDLDSSIESDLEASTSSVSSITSTGKGKGLAPLAPLGNHNKGKDPLGQLPSTSTSGLKHLSPLAPLGHGHLPSSLPQPHEKLSNLPTHLKPVDVSQKKLPSVLDKLHSTSGGSLEQSLDGDQGLLSPYDGNKKARDMPTDELEYSIPDLIQSASFEESSKLDVSETKISGETKSAAITTVEVTGKTSTNFSDDLGKGLNKATVVQSSAQVTRSAKGWDDPPTDDLHVDTSYVSEYPESFEESVASESHGSPQLKPLQQAPIPVKTIDDLLSDDEDYPETSPQRDHDSEIEEVRSSRADSIDTISRQKPSSISSREAFLQNESAKKTDLLSPVEGDDDDIYGHLDESIQHDDPSHSAILDESGDHANNDQNELSHSRRSNQEEEDDYYQIKQSSTIKQSLFSQPVQSTSNPNNRSKKSEEDEDEYFDDDFEDTDEEGGDLKNKEENKGNEDEESFVESLQEEIEEIEEDDNDFSYGGASSGDEDMLNRKDKPESKNSQDLFFRSSVPSRTTKPETTIPGRKNQPSSGLKYDHNSSDDEDLYIPRSQKSSEVEKKTLAKTDENSDDEDMYKPATSTAPKSLFGQKKPQPKYDIESDHDDVPETGSASDFSAGHSDDGESFLHESIEHKGRTDTSEFSMSEQEISGSHILDHGFDYTTNALPPSRKFGGR